MKGSAILVRSTITGAEYVMKKIPKTNINNIERAREEVNLNKYRQICYSI